MAARKSYRETPDVTAGIIRLVRSLGKRVAEGDPEDLEEVMRVARAVEDALHRGVSGLREVGHSDADIAEILGVSRQAVWQRFPRKAA